MSEQALKIRKTIGICRYLYNLYLASNFEVYETLGKGFFVTGYTFAQNSKRSDSKRSRRTFQKIMRVTGQSGGIKFKYRQSEKSNSKRKAICR